MSGIFLVLLLALAAAVLGRVSHMDGAFWLLPLICLSGTLLVLLGFFNLLPLALCLIILALLVIGVWGLKKIPFSRLRESLTSPALLLWVAGSVFLWALFALRQPMFNQWDEFTFWGNACRITKMQDMLHVGAPGTLAARAYMPGMMVISYLFQFLGDYAEWKVLAAYDILFFAAIAAAAALPLKHWAATVLAALSALLLPVFFSAPQIGQVSYLYRNAMGDLPLAFLFGGAVALWLGVGKKPWGKSMVACVLCQLTLTKDMGLAYALIVVGIAFLDSCVDCETITLKGIFCSIRDAVLLAIPVPVTYLAWSRYCVAAAGMDKNSVGSAGAGYGEILIGGVKQLVGIGRTEEFAQIMSLMKNALFSRTVCLLGSGIMALAVIFCVAFAAFLTGGPGRYRRRVALVTIGFAGAFVVFYLFHLLLYYYNFALPEAMILKDYERYISPYYLGWLLAELSLLVRAVPEAGLPRLNRLAVVGVAAALVVLAGWRGVPASGFWDTSDSIYSQRRDVQSRADCFNQVLDWSDRVLVLSQGDDATRWYYYGYSLNATVVNGVGGVYQGMYDENHNAWPTTFMNLVETLNWELYDFQTAISPEGLEGYLRTQNCAYLLVDRTDNYLVEEFGELFEGGLTLNTPATLYRIEDEGENKMRFTIAAQMQP